MGSAACLNHDIPQDVMQVPPYRFTLTNSNRNRFHGWTDEGINLYSSCLAKVGAQRADPKMGLQFEEDLCQASRETSDENHRSNSFCAIEAGNDL